MTKEEYLAQKANKKAPQQAPPQSSPQSSQEAAEKHPLITPPPTPSIGQRKTAEGKARIAAAKKEREKGKGTTTAKATAFPPDAESKPKAAAPNPNPNPAHDPASVLAESIIAAKQADQEQEALDLAFNMKGSAAPNSIPQSDSSDASSDASSPTSSALVRSLPPDEIRSVVEALYQRTKAKQLEQEAAKLREAANDILEPYFIAHGLSTLDGRRDGLGVAVYVKNTSTSRPREAIIAAFLEKGVSISTIEAALDQATKTKTYMVVQWRDA